MPTASIGRSNRAADAVADEEIKAGPFDAATAVQPLAQLLQEHVPLATAPAERRMERRRIGRRDKPCRADSREDPQGGVGPAGADPQLVDVFGVLVGVVDDPGQIVVMTAGALKRTCRAATQRHVRHEIGDPFAIGHGASPLPRSPLVGLARAAGFWRACPLSSYPSCNALASAGLGDDNHRCGKEFGKCPVSRDAERSGVALPGPRPTGHFRPARAPRRGYCDSGK